MTPRHDEITGHPTTGHEWDGITELDTRVPRLVWICLVATFVFAIGYWLLMPSWPMLRSATSGLLGTSDRTELAQDVRQAGTEQATRLQSLLGRLSPDRPIGTEDAALIRRFGARLFGDNCAACHGAEGKGGPGYPNLAALPRLWGDDVAKIEQTIRYGINSAHSETRVSQMPAFGRERMLKREEIVSLAEYIAHLPEGGAEARSPEAAALFAANCAACHGEKAEGNPEAGAPNLADRHWLYGGSPEAIYQSIWQGRQGQMPAWGERLSREEITLLAYYVRLLPEGR